MIQPFYASSAINRHGNYRNNKTLLNKIIIEKDTKFIPFYNGKNLFLEINKNITPVIFNKIQLDEFFPNGIEDTIFLGVAHTLNYMGVDKNGVMVVHGGGVYGDKEKTKERWCEQFQLLPKNVRKRLVLENCEKCFSVRDCLDIAQKINIPMVFDTHHYECYSILHPDETQEPPEDYIEEILETWKKRNIKPKFHVSEQGAGKCGHHSDYIEVIPEYLLEIPEKYGVHIDIMIEAKAKEKAIFKLYKKYPQLNCKIPCNVKLGKLQ